jgi:predicted PilT family ATPase
MLGLNLTLSLSRQAMMQDHRQRAARMTRDELAQLADELIQRAHQQEHMILELQRAAANLLVQMELKDAPAFGRVSEEHEQWAREVLGVRCSAD